MTCESPYVIYGYYQNTEITTLIIVNDSLLDRMRETILWHTVSLILSCRYYYSRS